MRTLYLRIVVTTMLIMIVSAVTAFLLSNIYYQKQLKPYNDQKITNMAKDIVSVYPSSREGNLDHYLQGIANLGFQMYLVDTNGKGRFYGAPFRSAALGNDVVQPVLNGEVYHGIETFSRQLFVTGFFHNELANSIGVPLDAGGTRYALFVRPNVKQQFGEMRIFLAVLLMLTLLLSFLLVIISTRYIVKPIKTLTDATKKVAEGNYHIQLNTQRKDEIGKLARHFLQMATSLKRLEDMRQEFVSNVSHEIQSPLSSIQGFSETLRTENLSSEQQEHYLSIIEKESSRLSVLSKLLLLLASLDKEEGTLEQECFDAAVQLKQVVMMSEWQWREKELVIQMDLPSTIVKGDPKLLYQVWSNLLTNAIAHTDAGGTISLKIYQDTANVHVLISDTGCGIPEKHLLYIFDRFYKTDQARTRKESGTGLGLSIVKKIIDLHEGNITVNTEVNKGTAFHIVLPHV